MEVNKNNNNHPNLEPKDKPYITQQRVLCMYISVIIYIHKWYVQCLYTYLSILSYNQCSNALYFERMNNFFILTPGVM